MSTVELHIQGFQIKPVTGDFCWLFGSSLPAVFSNSLLFSDKYLINS